MMSNGYVGTTCLCTYLLYIMDKECHSSANIPIEKGQISFVATSHYIWAVYHFTGLTHDLKLSKYCRGWPEEVLWRWQYFEVFFSWYVKSIWKISTAKEAMRSRSFTFPNMRELTLVKKKKNLGESYISMHTYTHTSTLTHAYSSQIYLNLISHNHILIQSEYFVK